MNRESRATVSFHLRSRRIELTRGQAWFEVAHSRLQTFEVRCGDAKVEDVGTIFDVRRFPDSVRVTVVEGRVRVSDRVGSRELRADEGATFRASTWGPIEPVNARHLSAWRHGKMVFEATPLSSVVSELTRYGAPAISFGDLAAARLPITGQFDIDRVNAVLDHLPDLAPVRVTRKSATEAIISSR